MRAGYLELYKLHSWGWEGCRTSPQALCVKISHDLGVFLFCGRLEFLPCTVPNHVFPAHTNSVEHRVARSSSCSCRSHLCPSLAASKYLASKFTIVKGPQYNLWVLNRKHWKRRFSCMESKCLSTRVQSRPQRGLSPVEARWMVILEKVHPYQDTPPSSFQTKRRVARRMSLYLHHGSCCH
jgi:hypothetical protein